MSNIKYSVFFLLALGCFFTSCQQPGGEGPGSEFMPDMAHSVANEANVYTNYSFNTWENSVKDLKETSTPRLPVDGTVARGFANKDAMDHHTGQATTNAISIPVNGSVPYYYADTEEERARAAREIIKNPFAIDSMGLVRGKHLYDIQCGICHGKKGDGNGWLVDEANPNVKYGAAPANFLQDTFYNSSNGRFYHAIMHGKNVMVNYADKLSYKERWEVIHYVRALMAKGKKATYDHTTNTFTSNAADTPCCPTGQWKYDAAMKVKQMAEHKSHDMGHGTGHGHDGGHGETHGEGHGHDGDAGHGGNHDSHDGHGHGESHDGH